MSVNNEGTIVYMTDRRDGSIQGRRLVASNGALGLDAEVRRCDRAESPNLTSDMEYATTVAVSPDNSNILDVGSHINHYHQKIEN